MKYKVCVIRDSAADVFGVPLFFGAIGQAVRAFSDRVQVDSKENPLFNHPQDFELFCVGEYDDVDASFECEVPRSLIRATDCRKTV